MLRTLSLFAAFGLLISLPFQACSQDKSKRPSPPKTATSTVGNGTVTVNYGSPSVKGRTIWGDLVAYDKVWRTGANEATTFETSGDIMVEGKSLPKGKYALFTIPGKEMWTIIFNSESDQWGAYKYDKSKDVLRVEVKPTSADMQEALAIDLDAKSMNIRWDKLQVPVSLSK